MNFDDYKIVMFRNRPDGWVAEIPSIPGCYALMETREQALVELTAVFQVIGDEYRLRNEPLPEDTSALKRTGAGLIAAMQASPHTDIDIEPKRH